LDNQYADNINYEISQIEEEFKDCKPLLDLCKLKRLDLIETMAAGSFVHSLYNGMENILIQAFKGIKENLPNDINWHKNLLEQAFANTDNREPMLNNEYKEKLNEYMRFRHLFRHTYHYKLDIEKLKPLVDESNNIWNLFKNDINNFLKKQLFINNEIEPMSCVKHNIENKSLTDLKGNITKITEIEKYDSQTSKLTFKDENSADVYVLQKNNGVSFDTWHFNEDFNKESALEFIKQWCEHEAEAAESVDNEFMAVNKIH